MVTRIRGKTLFYILIISFLIICTRIFIFKQIRNIYFVDSYYYLSKAINISDGKFISIERGFPFLYLLGFSIRLLSPILEPGDIAKILLITINLLLSWVVYLTFTHLISESSSFFATLFSMFEVSLLEYSLVPYLEIFALLMAWISLLMIFNYFKTSKFSFLIISLISSLVSGFTRFEMFAICLLPILFVLTIRSTLSAEQKEKLINFAAIIYIVIFLIFFKDIFISYYFSTTRFNPIIKLILGLRSDVVSNVFNSIFAISGIRELDFCYMILFIFGAITAFSSSLLKFIEKSRANRNIHVLNSIKYIFLNYENVCLLTYVVSILFELLILIAYGYSYTISDGQVNVFVGAISPRRFINIQILLAPLVIHFLSNINPTKIGIKIRFLKHEYGVIHIGTGTMLLCLFLLLYLPNMWSTGMMKVNHDSNTMFPYQETAKWLTEKLGSGQRVLLPLEKIFYFYAPELRDNALGYSVIWKKTGVILKADTAYEELLRVRRTLITYVIENPEIRFLVVDWMDPIIRIFKLQVSDELKVMLRPAHIEQVRSGSYRPQIVVYEVVRERQKLFEFNFTKGSKYKIASRNYGACIGNYTLKDEGLYIAIYNAKPDSTYAVYLPFSIPDKDEFNSFYSLCFSLKFKALINENFSIRITIYFDKNGDGAFDYDHDYTVGFNPLSAPTKLDEENYLFLDAAHNVIGKPVQIAFHIMAKDHLSAYHIVVKNIELFILGK
ncbi:MAG: hypothetical protein ACTSUX_05990 [Promethearchaeota archaeon]